MERGRRGNGRSVNDQHLVYRLRDTISYILRGPRWQGGCKDNDTTITPIAMCLADSDTAHPVPEITGWIRKTYCRRLHVAFILIVDVISLGPIGFSNEPLPTQSERHHQGQSFSNAVSHRDRASRSFSTVQNGVARANSARSGLPLILTP